ncbi:lipopolysaccharide biosynthesis protein [Glutamicibacter ardleyensis]|uniref:lipopolysaccharide biosynthesis protein n=1 Tax=Glutamicibacter ardleyensis TaxID=225894 RepID=UPI003FD378AF
MWRIMGNTALAKLLVMGMGGLLAVITGRIIIQNFGVDAYAQYGLLATLPALLPFADLGVGAVVINAISASKDPRKDDNVTASVVSALRILCVSGALIAALGVLLLLTGGWKLLLGGAVLGWQGELAATLCAVIFGLSLPLSIGQRLLIGLKRTTSQTMSQAVVAPFMLGAIALCVLLALPAAPYLAFFSYLAMVLVSVICLFMVSGSTGGMIWEYFRRVPRLRKYPSIPTMGLAWPMLLQMIALPVAMQTDRILLSHLRGPQDVAQYNLAAQLFGMAIQVINAGGMVLWPHFSKARADGEIRSPFKITGLFFAFGLIISAALAVIAPWLAHFMSDGKIQLTSGLLLAFVLFTTFQATKYPVGMYMTDFEGLRFQVLPIFCMVPLNLGLSIYLIGFYGPTGTVLGSCISVLLCQIVPNMFYVRKDLQRRRSKVHSESTMSD